MQNIKIQSRNKIDLCLTNSEYYDFYLANDEFSTSDCSGIPTTGDCLSVWFDWNQDIFATGTTSANTICSLTNWTGATNSGFTIPTIGLTGIDNGLITYVQESGDTSNTGLTSLLTGSTLVIPSGDTRLCLERVTGSSQSGISYSIELMSADTEGQYAKLCGGFYQGYYKLDGYDYNALPVRSNGWAANTWLRWNPESCSGSTGTTTLNSLYPNNSGFFFYMGTRAENKFWNVFPGNNTGCTLNCTVPSGCTGTVTTFCTVPKEDEIFIETPQGLIPLDPPPIIYTLVTNPFLIYGRADTTDRCGHCGESPSGFGNKTICSYTGGGITIRTVAMEPVSGATNPFLVYGRASTIAKCGNCGHPPSGFGNKTVCDDTDLFTTPITELNNIDNVVDNALGFRIKPDGSIGYRLLSFTGACSGDSYSSGFTVDEQYSVSGTVSANTWTNITIRFSPYELYSEELLLCGDRRKGRLMFYVNCYLKFVVDDFDEFIARRLLEAREKQVGVPFNISIGGGSQGLIETMTFDGQDPDDLGLTIEENFAGTFLGDISQFKFFTCDQSWNDIKNICLLDSERYNCELGFDSNVEYIYATLFIDGEFKRKSYITCGYLE